MKGYYKMPQQTGEVISADGWLRTGDQAVEDNDGYIRITGRLKDVIIRGGENIYPKEIEDFLRGIPSIRDVQIVAVQAKSTAKKRLPSCNCATARQSKPARFRILRGRIARYQNPKHIFFNRFLYPMTASGKIQKFKLREKTAARLTIAD